MGQSRWAMEMWVGSHYTIQPCDVSQDPSIKTWQVKDLPWKDLFNFSVAPRHPIRTMLENSEQPRYNSGLLDKETTRLRDYNLLGGMLLRWYLMYGGQPSKSSWIWEYYPDGDVWKHAIQKYRGDAIKAFLDVSRPYWPATSPKGT